MDEPQWIVAESQGIIDEPGEIMEGLFLLWMDAHMKPMGDNPLLTNQ